LQLPLFLSKFLLPMAANDTQTTPSPPPGDIGNHVIPLVIFIIEGTFALLAVVVRLVARYMMGRLGLADVLLVISLVRRSCFLSSTFDNI
jgi:hypothetical protein